MDARGAVRVPNLMNEQHLPSSIIPNHDSFVEARPIILFVCPRFHTNLIWSVRAINELGYRCVMVVSRQDRLEDHCGASMVLMENCDGIKRVKSYIDQGLVKLVFLRRNTSDSANLLNLIKKRKIKTVVYSQDPQTVSFSASSIKYFLGLWFERLRGLGTSHFYTVSQGRPKGLRLPLGFMPTPVYKSSSARLRISSDTVKVLCVGKLCQPRKRHLWIHNTLSGLEFLNIEVRIVGSTSIEQYGTSSLSEKYFRMLQLRSEVESIGGVRYTVLPDEPPTEMEKHYLWADLFVLPAKQEPFSISPYEALATGCPVLVSSSGGSSFNFREKDGCITFREKSFDDFSEKFLNLLCSPSDLTNLSQAALSFSGSKDEAVDFKDFVVSLTD